MPQGSLREISTLMAMRNENVVALLDIAVGRAFDQMYLILEFCEHDLARLVDHLPAPFPETVAKSLTVQLLKGLDALHTRFIIHRDIKLSNLRPPGQQRLVRNELSHDAPCGPAVHLGVIRQLAKEKLWRTVPERDDVGRLWPCRLLAQPGQPKVGNFEVAAAVEQEV